MCRLADTCPCTSSLLVLCKKPRLRICAFNSTALLRRRHSESTFTGAKKQQNLAKGRVTRGRAVLGEAMRGAERYHPRRHCRSQSQFGGRCSERISELGLVSAGEALQTKRTRRREGDQKMSSQS